MAVNTVRAYINGTWHTLTYNGTTWIEPIWWRSQQDVNYAKYLNDKIAKSGWNSLTVEERTKWAGSLIGSLNAIDLNRIEQDTQYLSDLLNSYAYMQSISCKTDWAMSSLPYDTEINRIITNVQLLIDSFHNPIENPIEWSIYLGSMWLEMPQWGDAGGFILLPNIAKSLNYIEINALEKVLKLTKETIHKMEDSFRYAGTFNAGQEVSL